MSHQPPNDVEQESEDLGTNNSWIGVWYLGEPRKMDREGRRLRIFQPDRKELAHLEKMTKRKATKRWIWKGGV